MGHMSIWQKKVSCNTLCMTEMLRYWSSLLYSDLLHERKKLRIMLTLQARVGRQTMSSSQQGPQGPRAGRDQAHQSRGEI